MAPVGTYYRNVTTGTVAVFIVGGRVEFATDAAYQAHRAELVALGGERYIPPANAGDITGLSDDGWATVCDLYQAAPIIEGEA
ncbi:hypothetical protein [Cryobacterium sp. AP23]